MRFPSFLHLAAICTTTLIPAYVMQAQLSTYTIVSAPLNIDTVTAVPGLNLKPGPYTIRVIDNLKDRYILGVADLRGKQLATFIGLREAEFPGNATQGPIQWENAPGKTSALRGYSFPNGLALEFVYPKGTAVEIAKLNTSSVPAIDPESEGISVDPKLSAEDQKVVSLWMLTSSRVGSGNATPAIEAKRFQARPEPQIAENTPPPTPNSPAKLKQVAASVGPVATKVAASDPDQNGKSKRRRVAATLPQTGSNLPIVMLLSAGLLLSGYFARLARRRTQRFA